MDDKNKTPQNEYSVDEILAEAHIIKNDGKKQDAGNSAKNTEDETAGQAPKREPAHEDTPACGEDFDGESVKSGAGEIDDGSDSDKGRKKKKKKLFSFLRRNKEYDDEDEEDDPYYGLQLKPLSEYRKEYENTMKINIRDGEKQGNDGSSEAPENMDETFKRIHEERRVRLEKIMRQAGMEPDEFLSDSEDAEISSKTDSNAENMPEGPVPEGNPVSAPPEMPPRKTEAGRGTESRPDVEQPLTKPEYEPPHIPETKNGEENTHNDGHSVDKANAQKNPGAEIEDGVKKSTINGDEDKGPSVPVKGDTPEPVSEPVRVPREKDGTPLPPPMKEPETLPRPQYRAKSGIPLHAVDLNVFEEVLREEAMKYQVKSADDKDKPGTDHIKNDEDEEPGTPKATEGNVPEGIPTETGEQEGCYVGEDNTIEFPKPFKPQPPEKSKKRFRIFGYDEPESVKGEETQACGEELDDYTTEEDAPSILNDLAENLSKLFIRLIASGIISAIMLVFSFAYEHLTLLPAEIHNVYTSQVFLIIQFVFLLMASAFCFPAISNGIKGIFKFKINADSAVSVAVAVTAVQNIVLLIHGMPSDAYLYSALAVCALFFNAAGKFSIEKRIMKNFKYVSSPGKKYAVQIFGDHNTALKLARGCVIGEPKIAYETEAGFLKNFLRFSYLPDPGERTSQSVGAIGIISSLALCAVGFLLTKDAVYAMDSFAAVMCVSVPFMNMLSVNLPVARLDKIAARCGSMVTGWHSVERFSGINAVMADDKDLFPKGTVILNGIKTFAGQRIDEAILDATALVCTVGGPLGDVFNQIIKNKREILPKASSVLYIDGKGVTGSVDGKKILVGNGELMKENSIEPPSRDYERKYIQSGKKLIYLASDGSLTAMFIVSYHSDRKRAMELKRMENNGVSLIVRTRDPNITPALISRCFGLSANSVSVLSGELGNVYADLQSAPPERIDAVMATKGRITSMMRVLTACIRQRGNISIAVVLQNTGAVLGLMLAALFICTLGLKQLSVTSLVIFEAFWAGAVTFIPRIRRP